MAKVTTFPLSIKLTTFPLSINKSLKYYTKTFQTEMWVEFPLCLSDYLEWAYSFNQTKCPILDSIDMPFSL